MKGSLNSQSKLMLDLMRTMLLDTCDMYAYSLLEAQRDVSTMSRRVRTEHESFLTKTLPNLGKALDSALLSGTYQCPTAFKRRKGTRLPCLTYGLLIRVFTSEGGIRADADPEIIRALRQVYFAFYKYDLGYTDSIVASFLEEFVRTDNDCGTGDLTPEKMASIYYAQEVINQLFRGYDLEKQNTTTLRNGPGASAGGEKPWSRFRPHRFYSELDELEAYALAYYYNPQHLFDDWMHYWSLPYGDGGTSKLYLVPKDSRGPRIISAEPHEKMAYQQKLRRSLYQYIERHPMTAGQVNFTDQTINGRLALEASRTGGLATLDLKSASDLLSLELVKDLFDETPIYDWLVKSRSQNIKTPNGTIALKKYAPMGNALTFPIQALVYYSLIVGRFVALGMPRKQAYASVYVYGDDIIVPTYMVDESMDVLTSMGLLVNTEKSCFNGYFRESCGVDAYKGVNVTPLKFKKVWKRNTDVSVLSTWLSYANNLFRKGYWKSSALIDELIKEQWGWLPLVSPDSPLLGFETWDHSQIIKFNKSKCRYSKGRQRYELKGIRPKGKTGEYLRSGWERLVNLAWNANSRRVEPFSTGNFTARHAVVTKHAVVGLDEVLPVSSVRSQTWLDELVT